MRRNGVRNAVGHCYGRPTSTRSHVSFAERRDTLWGFPSTAVAPANICWVISTVERLRGHLPSRIGTPSTVISNPALPNPYALRRFSVRRTPRACRGACDRLRPRQAPRQSRGLLALFDARTRPLRSKRGSGQRMRLDNPRSFCGEFSHARRLLRYAGGFFRILRHDSPLHSTSPASELQSQRNNG